MTPSGHSARRYHFPDHAPLVIRWPNHIKPGTVKNQLFAALDWLPTFVDIAGGPKGDGLKRQIEAGQYSGIVKQYAEHYYRLVAEQERSRSGANCEPPETPSRVG